jgi:hypothetical protein
MVLSAVFLAWPALSATNAAPIPDFSGIWGRTSVDFEPPPSGAGPVMNKTRTFYMRVGDDTNPILKPEAADHGSRRHSPAELGIGQRKPRQGLRGALRFCRHAVSTRRRRQLDGGLSHEEAEAQAREETERDRRECWERHQKAANYILSLPTWQARERALERYQQEKVAQYDEINGEIMGREMANWVRFRSGLTQ